jgi:hypothetical protein
MQWRFGTNAPPGSDLQGQLRRFWDRNYNVIVSRRTEMTNGVAAVNPDTNAQYDVAHVSSTSFSSLGTNNSPYTTIGQAQASGADVIYVHSGTVVSENVTLSDGQKLLGEGVTQTLTDKTYGAFTLPGAQSGVNTPIIQNSSGDAVTLANNSMISGFLIQNPVGNGIVASGKENIKISDVTIKNAGGDAIVIANGKSGSVSNVGIDGGAGNGLSILGYNDIDNVLGISNLSIQNVAGNGVNINGGHGTIHFTDQLVINNSGIAGFSVSNLDTLVTVDNKGTTTTADDVETDTPGTVLVDQIKIDGATGAMGVKLTSNDGQVGFGAVDITTHGGAAFAATDTDAIVVNNGYLRATNGPVADIAGSGINIKLTEIDATAGPVGLRIANTTGQFIVYGASTTEASGGTIQNTDVGLSLINAPTVTLNWVNFTGNKVVAQAQGGTALNIASSHITGTTQQFINATDLTSLQISGCVFENNTLSNGTGILFQADQNGTYLVNLQNSVIKDATGTFFQAQTLSGGEGSKLTYAFQSAQISLKGSNAIAAGMNWTGAVAGYAAGNTIVGTEASQTAFQFFTGTGADMAQLTISQNSISLGGVNGVAVDINTQSPSSTAVSSNLILFGGINGTGIRTTLGQASGISITGNQITDNAGGATGILFNSVEHGSTMEISSNTIDLSKYNALIDRGIVLSAISNSDAATDPFITFSSTANNTISGASTPLYVPTSGVQGQLIINGTTVQ